METSLDVSKCTIYDLDLWFEYCRQYKKGVRMSTWDYKEFTRLNHLVMEICHKIHNKNMLEK